MLHFPEVRPTWMGDLVLNMNKNRLKGPAALYTFSLPMCVLNVSTLIHLNNYTKWNMVDIDQAVCDSWIKHNRFFQRGINLFLTWRRNKSDWSQETAYLHNGRHLYVSLALFMISVLIHVHIRIKEGVSSVICVRGLGNTVPFLIKCFCPWIKTEVLQRGVSLACFAAFLRFIQSVVIIMVPFWPKFPPYSFTIHSKVNQFTCNTTQQTSVNISSQ